MAFAWALMSLVGQKATLQSDRRKSAGRQRLYEGMRMAAVPEA